jgi:hypothetical protein
MTVRDEKEIREVIKAKQALLDTALRSAYLHKESGNRNLQDVAERIAKRVERDIRVLKWTLYEDETGGPT